MKLFIQQLETGLFLDAAGHWVDSRDSAEGFARQADAIEFCLKHGCRDVQLLKVSDGGELYGYLQPFGDNDPVLQSSGLGGEVRSAAQEKERRERA